MRRLAQELDTGPASLYVYVRNTAHLHAAVLDELLGTVDLAPVGAKGDWRDRLANVLASYTDVLFAYPGLAQSALVARPSGPHYLRLIEAVLALLTEGGVPGGQAAWGVDLLMQFATATAAEHAGDHDERDEWDALTRALHGVSKRTHPHTAALAEHLVAGEPTTRVSWGVRTLINGIAQTPTPTEGATP
jgi:AcrR family transcriptional regulator